MPPGTYPTPANGGPKYAVLQDLPITYPGATVKEFKDGGSSYGLSNANGERKWLFIYDAITPAEAAVLDAHNQAANGIYAGFTFTHPRTLTVYSDVHYEEFTYP